MSTIQEYTQCACRRCKETFPSRKGKLYVDSKHANRHYNETRRKELNEVKNSVLKQLNLNEQLLKKFHSGSIGSEEVLPLNLLTAQGFDPNFHTNISANGYSKVYRYWFKTDQDKITITL